jgi:hypothetical protein
MKTCKSGLHQYPNELKQCPTCSKARKGEKRSEEACRNIAIGNQGKNKGPQSSEHIRNKVLANPRLRPIVDNLGNIHESINAAARYFNIKPNAISNQLAGLCKTTNGHVFSYLGGAQSQ